MASDETDLENIPDEIREAATAATFEESGLVPTIAQLSPDQPFGSIRSLAVSREVASFPLSRTPSPSPTADSFCSPNLIQVPDEETLVDAAQSMPMQRNGPRKSVSIVLPTEENE